jgi:translocation and assembly module TamB
MSYIVLGQPVAYTNEQSGLLEQASGKLLPAYTERKGISGGISGAATSKTQASTLPQSMITIGRYLTPELYISYGRSLLNDSNLVRLRYALSKKWEIETQTGSESGGDIYFKINFK